MSQQYQDKTSSASLGTHSEHIHQAFVTGQEVVDCFYIYFISILPVSCCVLLQKGFFPVNEAAHQHLLVGMSK